jgi:tRNA(fMet)-specific endonuclease VapC
MNVLPFDETAQSRFRSLRKQCRRLGTLDLRIASIALTTDATLVSRNLRDFRQVPGLRVEDWTKPE